MGSQTPPSQPGLDAIDQDVDATPSSTGAIAGRLLRSAGVTHADAAERYAAVTGAKHPAPPAAEPAANPPQHPADPAAPARDAAPPPAADAQPEPRDAAPPPAADAQPARPPQKMSDLAQPPQAPHPGDLQPHPPGHHTTDFPLSDAVTDWVITIGGRRYRMVTTGTVTVGRATEPADPTVTTIASPFISRRHCEFAISDSLLLCSDLGSMNGTWLMRNEQYAALEPDRWAELLAGDVVLTVEGVELARIDTVPLGAGSTADRQNRMVRI